LKVVLILKSRKPNIGQGGVRGLGTDFYRLG
jgi:hypothetical protein